MSMMTMPDAPSIAPGISPPVENIDADSDADTIALVKGLVDQSMMRQQDALDRATQNLRLALGDQWDWKPPADVPLQLVVFNMVGNAVRAAAQNMVSGAVRPVVTVGRDTGRCWYGLEQMGLAKLIQAKVPLEPGVVAGYLPVTKQQAMAWATAGLIGNDEMFEIDVDAIRQDVQDNMDGLMDESKIDPIIRHNTLCSNTYGWQPLICFWDRPRQRMITMNAYSWRTYPDMARPDPGTMRHMVYDGLFEDDEAAVMFPQWAELIHAKAMYGTGGLENVYANLGMEPGFIDSGTFRVKQVWIRFAWLKWQKVKASESVAMARGLAARDVTGKGWILPPDVQGGQPVPTAPDQPNWPMIDDGLRLIVIIGGTDKAYDGRADFSDFNIAWNRCIPIPNSPLGQGIPEQLEGPQKAENVTGSVLVNHVNYHQSPMEWMTQDTYELNKDDEANMRGSFFGRRLMVPNDRPSGESMGYYVPPPPPNSIMDFWMQLRDVVNDTAGQPDTSRGVSDPNARSGVAIQTLTDNAKGAFGYLAQTTEDMLQHIGRLYLEAIQNGWVSEYKWHYLLGERWTERRSMLSRQLAMRMKMGIEVQLYAGSGAVQRRQTQEALLKYQSGTATLEDTLERSGEPNPAMKAAQIMKERATVPPVPGSQVAAQGPKPVDTGGLNG